MIIRYFLIAATALAGFKAHAHTQHVTTVQQQVKKMTENQKIEHLIAYIAKQDGVFIRNGSEYTPGQAAEHLRMKWKKGGSSIKTAADFIDKLASASSMSGKPYQIRLKNGKVYNVGPWLKLELARIEK